MKQARRLTWGGAKVWLGAALVAAVLLVVGNDRTPTYAVTTEIGPSLSSTSATWLTGSKLLVKGGDPSVAFTPCSPGGTGPTTICAHIWAKNISDPTGVSAFQVHFTWPTDRISVSVAASSITWLGSTGRSAACGTPVIHVGEIWLWCNTISAPPPFGPTSNGIIANLAIESGNTVGPATINFSTETFVVNTGTVQPTEIPATVRSLGLFVAPCADLVAGDNKVTSADILYVVQKYGTNNAAADLDSSGQVASPDILVAVGEYGSVCTR